MEEKLQRVEITAERVARLLDRAKGVLPEEDYQDLEDIVKSFVYLTDLLEQERMTVRQLRRLLFGFKSEKLRKIFEKEAEAPLAEENPPMASEEKAVPEGTEGAGAPQAPVAEEPALGEKEGEGEDEPKKRKGHGRAGADAYEGAERIRLEHPSLRSGDPCPQPGCQGRVYRFVPRKLVRVVGQAPVSAKVIELEQLRCNLCLKVFGTAVPEGTGEEKYDATAASMIALLRYGTGVPFNRLEGLQKSFGIPLPASTQWDVVERAAKKLAPAYAALVGEAAQGDVLYSDDTTMRILQFMKKKERKVDDG